MVDLGLVTGDVCTASTSTRYTDSMLLPRANAPHPLVRGPHQFFFFAFSLHFPLQCGANMGLG